MADFANQGDLANLEPVAQPAAKHPDVSDVASSMRKEIVKARFRGGKFENTTAVVATVQKMRAHAKDPTAHAALQIAEQDLTEPEKEALAKATRPAPAPKAREAVPEPKGDDGKDKGKDKNAKKAKPEEKGAKKETGGKGVDKQGDPAPAPPAVEQAAAPDTGEAPAKGGEDQIEEQLSLHEQWEKEESAELKSKLGANAKHGIEAGLVKGLTSAGIGIGIQAIAKKIPLEGVGNVIGLGVMLASGGGIRAQLGKTGKEIGDAAKGLFSSHENWALKLADAFTLLTSITELVAQIANILSGAAYAFAGLSAVLAALGWILSFFFPPLAAVAALLTEAVEPLMSFGKLAGTVGNVATIVSMVFSPLPPIFRAKGIELIEDDPEQIQSEEEKFTEETEAATSAYTNMAASSATAHGTDGKLGSKSPFENAMKPPQGASIRERVSEGLGVNEVKDAFGEAKEKTEAAHPVEAYKATRAKYTDDSATSGGGDDAAQAPEPEEKMHAPSKDERHSGASDALHHLKGDAPSYQEARDKEDVAGWDETIEKGDAATAKTNSEAAAQKVNDAEKVVADAQEKFDAAEAAAEAEKKGSIEDEARGGGRVAIDDPEHGPNADELAKMDELPPAEKEALKAKHELAEAKKALEEAKRDAKKKADESKDAAKAAHKATDEHKDAKEERVKALKERVGTGGDVLKDALKKPLGALAANAVVGEEEKEEPVMLPSPPAPGSLAVVKQLDAEIQRLNQLAPAISSTTQQAAAMKTRAQHDADLIEHSASGFQSQQQARMQAGTIKQQAVDTKGQQAETQFNQTATTAKGGTGQGAGAVKMIAHMIGWLDGLAHKVPDSKFFHTKPLISNVDKFKTGTDMVAGGPAKSDEVLAPAKPRVQQRKQALAKATASRGKTQQATASLHSRMKAHAQENKAASAQAASAQQQSAGMQQQNAAALAATKQKRAAEWAKWTTWAAANKSKYDEWKEQQAKKKAAGGAE